MKQYSSPWGGGSPPSVSEAWKRSACGRTHRRRHEPCRRPWRGNGKAMRRRPGSANPMACSGPGNATADGSSKISAVRFRAESSCGRFDDTAAVPSGRSASPDYRSNPHGGTMTRRTSMRKAPADPLPENANRRHAPLKRRRRWFRMAGGPDRPILLDRGWCRFVGLVIDSITTDHATRPSPRRRSMMLMPNSVLMRLSRYQTM